MQKMLLALPYIVYCVAWIAVGAAVAYGIYMTKDARCLWAFVIPAMIGIKQGKNEE
jgi:hypothetical protein